MNMPALKCMAWFFVGVFPGLVVLGCSSSVGAEEVIGQSYSNDRVVPGRHCMYEPIGYCVWQDDSKRILFSREATVHEWAEGEKILIDLDAREIESLIDPIVNFLRGKFSLELDTWDKKIDSDASDDLPVLSSVRKKFDAPSAVERCSRYFKSGGMPRRMSKGKDKGSYVFDCVLPGRADGGYWISIKEREGRFVVSSVDYYQYDILN